MAAESVPTPAPGSRMRTCPVGISVNIAAMKSAMLGAVPKCPRSFFAIGSVTRSKFRCCLPANLVKVSVIPGPDSAGHKWLEYFLQAQINPACLGSMAFLTEEQADKVNPLFKNSHQVGTIHQNNHGPTGGVGCNSIR